MLCLDTGTPPLLPWDFPSMLLADTAGMRKLLGPVWKERVRHDAGKLSHLGEGCYAPPPPFGGPITEERWRMAMKPPICRNYELPEAEGRG